MSPDRFTPALDFKSAGLEQSGEFHGLASTFGGPPDAYGDVIAPGAFHDTLIEHHKSGSTPALLWCHDVSQPCGRWLSLNETDVGLEAHGKLTLETRRGAEAYALMRDKALGLSIGYRVAPGGMQYQQSGGRLLTKIELFEVSAVSLPANAARITSVKSRPSNIRELEGVLRDSRGFSRREAKAIASHGWSGLDRKSDELFEVAALLRAVACRFNQ